MIPATLLALALAASPAQEAAPSAEAVRDLVFLADNRPVFLRLRVMLDDRPFEASWMDSVRTLHASLDRNGDGKVTTKEADKDVVAALVRLAAGAAVPGAVGELDVNPKDDVISIEELADGLRPILGPFRLQVGRQAVGRTDALFDQLDRDKDGQLTRSELAGIAGSLRPLDLDDNEMISAEELEPFNSPAVNLVEVTSERRARFTALPSVVELIAGESSLRSARLLLKKYDKGKGDVPGRPDNKLSPTEFAIDPEAFASADKNGDEMLDTDELRRFLARAPIDLVLDIMLSPKASTPGKIQVGGGGALPKGAKVRQLADGDVEFAIGRVRIDVQVDDRDTAAEEARRVLTQRFKAADANKDGYLEGKELTGFNAQGSPVAGLSPIIDRDADGKLYLKELLDFADRQVDASRGRLVVTTSDQARAIFGILDLDRDRRLGAREVMRTVDRVTSWDSDGDGRISADEIPYHFQVKIGRGVLAGLGGGGGGGPIPTPGSMGAMRPAGPEVGPDWFRKMDRNHDGDVSRREFLGPREQFDRLDRDKDGLIDADEAGAPSVAKGKGDGSRP